MKYNTVKSLFTAICDAIRESDGTYSQIGHQDIPERIRSLPGTAESSVIMTRATVIDTECDMISIYAFDEDEIGEETIWNAD